MDGPYTAVVDRIEDGQTAVILVEEDGEVVEQFDLPADELPDEANEGGVLAVTIAQVEIVDMEFLADETRDRREAMRERLDRLSKRLTDRD